MVVDGVPEEVLVESLEEIDADADNGRGSGSRRPRASRPGDVTTSMPGTVVEVLVTEGQSVEAGEPVLVVEAMKMETEIQAPVSGTVRAIHVARGDHVNPDEALVEIEPS